MKKTTMFGRAIVLGGIILLGLATTAQAQTWVLGDLTNTSAGVVIGDKIFTNFTYTAVGDMPANAYSVNVSAIFNDPSDIGLRFQGAFYDAPGGGSSDALITFKVMSTVDEIWKATLAGNPSVSGDGYGEVVDTWIGSPYGGNIKITPAINTATRIFSPAVPAGYLLPVQKDILLDAGTGTASLSFVDQTFQQTPEPSSLTLLGLGGLLAYVSRRRRS